MRSGVCIPNFGSYADSAVVADLARTAEAAGWESLFVWDHHAYVWGPPTGDPWVTLAACTLSTSHLLLGTAVTPLPRRRIQDVALTLATLDHLSAGRIVFGAGLGGAVQELAAFGEETDEQRRAQMLDEGLDLLRRMLNGEEIHHRGKQYLVDGVRLSPASVSTPLPFWIGGNSRPALRRAARWDGWVASSATEDAMSLTPSEIADCVSTIRAHRESADPFEVAVIGYSEPGETDIPREYSEAGATWWLESIHDLRGDVDATRGRILAGPLT
jgi:alkanesulfonate monooxygenase SsuD/methylene tetrahydromethanopterin reductase-like flavin-dependent oxidoreductase (luciferase family)